MFLFKSDFRKDIIILIVVTILLGSVLVVIGGYLTDNYFVSMVSGIIGDYGEYDLLFTIASDSDELAYNQIGKIANDRLPGSRLITGPKVAGSSNFFLEIPDEFKNEEIYVDLGRYFSDIPGMMSITTMTEPRLSIRGFRGNTRSIMRPLLEEIDGIDFLYPTSDGLDIIVEKPELVSEIQREITNLINSYTLLEIRYPLDYKVDNLHEKKNNIMSLIGNDVEEVIDVTGDNDPERVALLSSLQQMQTFLLSYASKVVIEDLENSDALFIGSRLLAKTSQDSFLELKVIEKQNQEVIALIEHGDIENISSKEVDVFHVDARGQQGEFLASGIVNNPRQDLALTLERLDEIAPTLDSFIAQSEQLIVFSDNMADNLSNVNQGLGQLANTSQRLTDSLNEWQQQGLSDFLDELLTILDDIRYNVGDISDIQRDLIRTSNSLKEGAALIEERIAFVPRNNIIYEQLFDLKEVFLLLATNLDSNYDVVSERLDEMNPVISSIDGWQDNIQSLLRVEETLNSGADWDEVEGIIEEIEQTANVLDTDQLQESLSSIQGILLELQEHQLPIILNQLSYIQNSLPDLREEEIVETLNLIDSYIAGEVIPGEQIQLLIKGDYNSKSLIDDIKTIVYNPAVTFIEMDPGLLQPNPRAEIFNILTEVRAVITTIIALIYILLIMILDQSLIISILKIKKGYAYLYAFLSGGIILTMISFIGQIQFAYINPQMELVIGGGLGVLLALLSNMLNPVNYEEWEAGIALGFSPAEIMHEIIIPSGKPGLLYLLNYPKMIFRNRRG
ncbi:hypothetical protein [Natronospora cellulosivora (SeqCode)]